MKNALLFVSGNAGRGLFSKHKGEILSSLGKLFDSLEVVESYDLKTGEESISRLAHKVDALIVLGGDGTFFHVINWLYRVDAHPKLAYINGGTLGDVGRNFGVSKNYKKAIELIAKGHLTTFDVVKAGEYVFAYMGAVGAFSEIAYVTKREKKKRLGVLSYYFASLGEAFRKRKHHISITFENGKVETDVPFLLLLNGGNVGGFPINKPYSINDGLVEVYLPKPGFLNGLLPFFFSPKKVNRLSLKAFSVHMEEDLIWCFDGEKGGSGDISVEVLPSFFEIYSIDR